MNIYKKQQMKLGLTDYEYSELVGLPYEIVIKFLNGKEEEIDMNFRNFFNNKMMEGREKIEKDNNKEEKIIELKSETSKILNWFENDFKKEELFEKTNTNNANDFFNKIAIYNTNGKEVSYLTLSRIFTKNVEEMSRENYEYGAIQLYNIMVNNKITYKNNEKKEKTKENKTKCGDKEFLEWFKNFDLEKYIIDNFNGNKHDFIKASGISTGSTYNLMRKDNGLTTITIKKLYDYVFANELHKETIEEDIEFVEDMIGKNEEQEVVEEKDNNDMLRELLRDRLTDKEIMLIELFGGKVR